MDGLFIVILVIIFIPIWIVLCALVTEEDKRNKS